MQIYKTRDDTAEHPAGARLLSYVQENQALLGLTHAELYYRFPFYRNEEGELVICPVLIASPTHGVIVLGTTDATPGNAAASLLKEADRQLDEVYGHVVARLMKNSTLRAGKRDLSFPLEVALFAPFIGKRPSGADIEAHLLDGQHAFREFLTHISQANEPLADDIFRELLSTLQGAKGLLRPARRNVSPDRPQSMGALASKMEAEISNFDLQQKRSYLLDFSGPQRIRGLAGSGKTVILALRAALLHLTNPNAKILYTFYTKSLYQHIRLLITRFYRQFDEKDPDWEMIRVLHAWGGRTVPGVYSETCARHDVPPLAYSAEYPDPFGHVCQDLLSKVDVTPYYDYVLIDEGQDFPHAFLRLCRALAIEDRFVLAYDELQTIFQKAPPTVGEVYGVDETGQPLLQFQQDISLRKCYRNSRPVLVLSHAIGFGIYHKPIVQMIEEEDNWQAIGYEIRKGPLTAGTPVVIERPEENSPLAISSQIPLHEMVKTTVYADLKQEVAYVVGEVHRCVTSQDLRPDDIMVICVDDRSARVYLKLIDDGLRAFGIRAYNTHAASYSATDFRVEGAVTLCTVHKAKGNEAFVVFVVGADARFHNPDVRDRNVLFTAMTRAKGWLRISGVGTPMKLLVEEIGKATENFPNLSFIFPSAEDLRIMRRDLALGDKRLTRIEERLSDLTDDLNPDELEALVDRLRAKAERSGGARPKAPPKK